jgi:serine/threonine protein kinase/WD40 repeat protein
MSCLSTTILQRWLCDQLGPDSACIESHIEQCADCQEKLAELTGAGWSSEPFDARQPFVMAPSGGSADRLKAGRQTGCVAPLPPAAVRFLSELERQAPTRMDDTGPGSPLVAEKPPEVPGFEILDELGRGGMAVVYRARARRLNRIVALKMIPESQASPAALVRLRLEAEAVAHLHHSNILQIHDLGSYAGRLFLVLEFIDGPTLAQHCAGIPQAPRWASQLTETLARAMHHAHERGIVHRDLKPANVLLSFSREPLASATPALARGSRLNGCVPKIADFGLAQWELCDAGLTSAGAILGTPSYMAPEQAAGNRQAIGPASDVYALGAILYDMLTGRPPFRADSWHSTLRLVEQQEPVPPRRFQASVPRDLETICLKCLHKEPARRYASAAHLADDLERFLTGQPIAARPVSRFERGWRWCRRHPGSASLSGLVAALLLLLVVGSTLSALWVGQERDSAVEARLEAERARQEATTRLWETQLEQAHSGRLSQRPGQRLDSLALLDSLAQTCPNPGAETVRARLRDEIIACLALPDLSVAACWTGCPPGNVSLAFATTLQRCARRTADGVVSIRRVPVQASASGGPGSADLVGADPEFQRLKLPRGAASLLQLSPDGLFLVANLDPGPVLKVWRLADPGTEEAAGAPRVVIDASTEGTVSQEAVDFSSDGRWFACALDDGQVLLYDLSRQTDGLLAPVRRLPPCGSRPHDLAISPDSAWVAVALNAPRPVVRVRDLATGAVLADLPQQSEVYTVAWHPDGERLAVAGAEPQIQLWNVARRERTHLLECETRGIRLVFNHTGTLLASNGNNGRLRLWDPSSGQLRFVTQAEHGTLCFSRDDRFLAATLAGPGRGKQGDGIRLKVYEVNEAREYRTLRPQTGAGRELLGCAFSPDQRWLAVGMEGGVRLFDLVSGQERVSLGLPFRDRSGETATPVSPDGRWLTRITESGELQVQDARTAAVEVRLPVRPPVQIAFSPDGAWLMVRGFQPGFGCRLWSTRDWQAGPRLGGRAFAFAPDSRLLAVETGRGVIRLINPATGCDLARLEDPSQDVAAHLCFSPDGGLLVNLTNDSHSVHIWDLRLIRTQLARRGLDFAVPPRPGSFPD